MKPHLTIELLQVAAEEFCKHEFPYTSTELFGTDNGKTIGDHIEKKFQEYLNKTYKYKKGSSSKGLDLPEEHINTDIKTTSSKKPQSSSTFKNAQQKIFGLGYNLLLFVYDKQDNPQTKAATLNLIDCTFISKEKTADYTTTHRIRELILKDGANADDLVAYLNDRNIPADEITLRTMAEKMLQQAPHQGYLTISNALQWRLQYSRVVGLTETVDGISKLTNKNN
ncbi:MAG: restriction endonuclease [Aureispira sp.]